MHEQLWFTALLNKFLAAPVAAALAPLGARMVPEAPTVPLVLVSSNLDEPDQRTRVLVFLSCRL